MTYVLMGRIGRSDALLCLIMELVGIQFISIDTVYEGSV
jgi:hypothetical protein